jgi:glucose-1-phosphate adenylyltransferase
VQDVIALVLAGGGGQRLSVLAVERAVSAVPFGGKYRIIDFALSNCSHSDVRRVGVITQHAPASLHDHIGSGRVWDLDGREHGVSVLQPFLTRDQAGWYRGTADALAQNWDAIEESRASKVLVLSGDQVCKMDYRALIHEHERTGAAVTLGVMPVEGQAHRFGMVHTDDDGRVSASRKSRPRPMRGWLRWACTCSSPKCCTKRCAAGRWIWRSMWSRVLVGAGHRVQACRYDGYFEDVGEISTYYRASMDLLQPQPRLILHDERWPILTRDEERPPVLVLPGAEVNDSLVANAAASQAAW